MSTPSYIGAYRIIREIGKGGMGEVFLAFDPVSEREIALKKVRGDLKNREVIRRRFLREAKITGQLAHPSIVPIYNLHEENSELYYTMPYIEGATLKELLLEGSHSIPSLAPIFFSICQAIAFAHSRGYIHRDIKPENVLVGKYGQVQILDWGLVKDFNEPELEIEIPSLNEEGVTQPGKIVGTLAYMAPERMLHRPSTILSDIYALGVILYQILALRLPFRRSDIKTFKRHFKDERFIDPAKKAPYRDVPPELAHIARKCLFKQPKKRYQSVDDLIRDLKAYFEGRSQWFAKARLEIDTKKHWLFQEHLVMQEHNLIIRGLESTEWVLMMVSKELFTGNVRMLTSIRFEETSHGLGLMLGVPDAEHSQELGEGFCLWITPLGQIRLLKSHVTLMEINDFDIQTDVDYTLIFEKIDTKISFFLNDLCVLSYTSHLPITAGHIGVLFKDRNFHLDPISIFVGSLNLAVSCLSIPDAFLAARHYSTALAEYRRIGTAFSGRAEGREALFRAGITLLEEASSFTDPELRDLRLETAHKEFEKLRFTAASPLEYLGKALIYESKKEIEEEAKCFHFALRRYKNHPLLKPLQEQLLMRLHESSRKNRTAAFRFMLIVLQTLCPIGRQKQTTKLIKRLERYSEQLPFIAVPTIPENHDLHLACQLAFWLCQTSALEELALMGDGLVNNCWSALLHLGKTPPTTYNYSFDDLLFLMEEGFDRGDLFVEIPKAYNSEEEIALDCRLIWKDLLNSKFQKAMELLHKYPMSVLSHEINILHFLFGCALLALEGEAAAAAHLSGIFDTAFPRTWQTATHFLYSKDFDRNSWMDQAFYWEKKQLYRQLFLFYHCAGDEKQRVHYQKLLRNLNYE